MEKIKVAVVGFGNVGQEVLAAVQESPDMSIAGIIELPQFVDKAKENAGSIPVVSDVRELGDVDVAILAINSRAVPKVAPQYLKTGISTVDPYDIHGETMVKLRQDLDKIAKDNDAVSIIGAGWDPGTNSIIRVILETIAPKGLTTVNYGPGMSMGHTVAVKAIPGVKDAIAITVPKGMSIHKRIVYMELEDGFDFQQVADAIKKDSYFAEDETHVFCVDDVKALIDTGHGVHIDRKGVSGRTHNQRMNFSMTVCNPAATGQIMASAARACKRQRPGCYTLIEIPPVDFIYGDRLSLVNRLF